MEFVKFFVGPAPYQSFFFSSTAETMATKSCLALPLLFATSLLASCGSTSTQSAGADVHEDRTQPPRDGDDVTLEDSSVSTLRVRFATFNTSLYGQEPDDVATQIINGSDHVTAVIDTIIENDPDVLVINELDYDEAGVAVNALCDRLNAAGKQRGLAAAATNPAPFPNGDIWSCVAFPSNTGVHAGVDLNQDGTITTEPGSAAYANDSFGFGTHPGQYAFALVSKHPINLGAARSFQNLLWQDVPQGLADFGFYDDAALDVFRLSSKNHVDVPVEIRIDEQTTRSIHVLMSHPTPPSFDGPEDRNGRRNSDEIRLWVDYVSGDSQQSAYLCDDDGACGGLASDASFVVAGDLNSDPSDGDLVVATGQRSIEQLLQAPRIQNNPTPTSLGGPEQSISQAGANTDQAGDPAHDTADFSDRSVGNLRVDYVLPSTDLTLIESGVFWPLAADPLFQLVGTTPFPASDHRLVWVDLELAR